MDNLKLLVPILGPMEITSKFGLRKKPLGGGMQEHRGVDITSPKEFPFILAAIPGKIIYTKNEKKEGFGKWILQEAEVCGRKLYLIYAHLKTLEYVHIGQQVWEGTKLSIMGNTGHSTGKHLHFQVMWDNAEKENYYKNCIDPEKYFYRSILC